MIRILVISLVVANLLLLGFQSSRPAVRPETRPTPVPASASAKQTGIPTIHLFSEMVQDQDLMSGNRRCFTLGPFHDSGDREEVHARLLKVSPSISERETEALVEKGYWVFMPPYASLLEANEELLLLQALGLKDIGIIYDGEWKNAISLGYFMRQENAVRRKQDLESRGHKPIIRIQRQAEPRYWLDYEQSPGSGLIALDMQNRPNDFMQRPLPCPEAEFLEGNDADLPGPGQDLAQLVTPEEDAEPAAVQGKVGEKPDAVGEVPEAPVGAEPDQPAASTTDARIAAPADGETVSAEETGDETPGGQSNGNVADKPAQNQDSQDSGDLKAKTVETPAVQAEEKDAESSGKTLPDKDEGGTSGVKAETLPKQAVGTGPDHALPVEPGQASAGASDQGADTPAGQEPVNTPEADKESSSGEDSGKPSAAADGPSSEPAGPEKEETGGENGAEKDNSFN